MAEAANQSERPANRLAACSSPYLQQHARNPVDWYPWGEEAQARARAEDRPILLSIGYSTCHWCHVMARECFEDPDIAALMNRLFVNVKVDREERPDLDDIYMRALQIMTGSGGWPLTVFLTPDLVPFYGGTYYPPVERHGLPAFPRVLEAVAESYREHRGDVDSIACNVLKGLAESSSLPASEGDLRDGVLMEQAARSFASQYDMECAGFGTSPKFLQAPGLDFLLRFWAETGDLRAHLMLSTTLDRMAAGGIFDHVGGGFHRYCTDQAWLVPHFEKMLCDNALLMGVYADAARAYGSTARLGSPKPGSPPRAKSRGGKPAFVQTARAVGDYLLREMAAPEGCFYTAQDADNPDGEGAYYTWTYDALLECLGPEDAPLAAAAFGASRNGRSVLHRPAPLKSVAEVLKADPARVRAAVERGRLGLLEARARRAPPAIDRKVLTDWNALAVSGFVRLHRATGEPRYLNAARRCAGFLLEGPWWDGALMHCWKDGDTLVPAFLSDYAALAAALLDLHEATFDLAYLRRACELAEAMRRGFWDEQAGVFAESGATNERLIAPVCSLSDQPTPSGCALACHVLLRLAPVFDEPWHGDLAERVLHSALPLMESSPMGTPHMLAAALRYLSMPRELVMVGPDAASVASLRAVADGFYLPNLVVVGCTDADCRDDVPLLRGRASHEGKAVAYLCAGGVCREPMTGPDRLREQIGALVPRRP